MHTLFDILESSLPEGAELKNKKETSNRFKYDFCFNGISVHGEICKAVAPGSRCQKIPKEKTGRRKTQKAGRGVIPARLFVCTYSVFGFPRACSLRMMSLT